MPKIKALRGGDKTNTVKLVREKIFWQVLKWQILTHEAYYDIEK